MGELCICFKINAFKLTNRSNSNRIFSCQKMLREDIEICELVRKFVSPRLSLVNVLLNWMIPS